MGMYKAIVKKPSELFGHESNVFDNLQSMQEIVGGYIETLTLDSQVVIICNEEGRIRGMDPNCVVCGIPFYGPIIAIGYDGRGNFADLPISMNRWKNHYLNMKKIGG